MFNYIVPTLFIVISLIELVFAGKLQERRDRRRIATGKEAETAVDVRRSTGIMGITFGALILCYVFIL